MRAGNRVRPRNQAGVSCGNAGAVESVESQRQAPHSFHEPPGNLAKSRRDFHISTAPATRADGKVENQKHVSQFPTAPSRYLENQKTTAVAAALRAAAPMTSTGSVHFLVRQHVGFKQLADVDQFLMEFLHRLRRLRLELHPDKTRRIEPT